MDKVSIIILTKDNPKIIKDCVQSIQKHVKYPNYEIIIGDTNSKNKKTLQFYRTLKQFKNIKIIKGLKYNFGNNYNKLILNHCDSPYVVIQNNDTVARNDYITAMMKYAVKDYVGAVGAQLLYPNGTIQHIGQLIFNPKTGIIVPAPTHYALGKNPREFTEYNYYVDGVTCACMMIKRDKFIEVDGFDEEYQDIYQDVDLNLKLRHTGYEIVQCNDAILIHYDNYTRKNTGKNYKVSDKVQHDVMYLHEKWDDRIKFVFTMEEAK